jgi:uncharacterized protein
MLEAYRAFENYLPSWSALGAVLDRGQLVQARKQACGVGQNYIVIDPAGQVSKCHMDIDRKLGNVFKHDPLMLVREVNKPPNPSVEDNEGCQDCTWRYWCAGGCPLADSRVEPAGESPPYCRVYQTLYPAAIRLEGLRLQKYAAIPNLQSESCLA